MKRVIIIFLICLSLPLSGTTYYVSNTGNDSHTGTSQATAWATITKVNATSFAPGDSILFKCGDTWRTALVMPSSGTKADWIYFGSYGTGRKPKLWGSLTTSWSNYSGNIWKSNSTFSNPHATSGFYGGLFLEYSSGDSTKWGYYPKTSIGLLTEERQWFWNSSDSYIYLYCPEDPDTRYSSVEVAYNQYGITMNNKNYIVIDGLDIRHTTGMGIRETWPFRGITFGLEVKNCYIGFLGVKGQDNGMGIQLYHSQMNIHHNKVEECGRRMITARTQDAYYAVKYLGATDPVTLDSVAIHDNICHNGYHAQISLVAEDTSGFFNRAWVYNNFIYDDSTNHVDVVGAAVPVGYEGYNSGMLSITGCEKENTYGDVWVYNNVLIAPTGFGLKLGASNNVKVYNNTVYGLNQNCYDAANDEETYEGSLFINNSARNSIIKNNIFYNDYPRHGYHVRNTVFIENNCTGLTFDNNLYYNAYASQPVWSISGLSSGLMSAFTAYKAYTGYDTHSPTPSGIRLINPDLGDIINGNWSLQASSPAVGAGVNVGLSKDYEGNSYRNPPSIGAFECILTGISDVTYSNLSLFPNPAKDYFRILLFEKRTYNTLKVIIYDQSGKKVYMDSIEIMGQVSSPVSINLSPGVYIVQVISDNTILAIKKIIIG